MQYKQDGFKKLIGSRGGAKFVFLCPLTVKFVTGLLRIDGAETQRSRRRRLRKLIERDSEEKRGRSSITSAANYFDSRETRHGRSAEEREQRMSGHFGLKLSMRANVLLVHI